MTFLPLFWALCRRGKQMPGWPKVRTKPWEDTRSSITHYVLHTYTPITRFLSYSSTFGKVGGQFSLIWNMANHRRPSSGMMGSPRPDLPTGPWAHRERYLRCSGVGHFLVQADVQIVAGLIGQEETNGNGLPRGCQTDVDLQLGLEDAELPKATPVAHHHAPHGLFNLKTQEKSFPHLSGLSPGTVTPPARCCKVLLTGAPQRAGGASQGRRDGSTKEQHVPSAVLGPGWPVPSHPNKPWDRQELFPTREPPRQKDSAGLTSLSSQDITPQQGTACPPLPLHSPSFPLAQLTAENHPTQERESRDKQLCARICTITMFHRTCGSAL